MRTCSQVLPFDAEHMDPEGFRAGQILADAGRFLSGGGDQPLDAATKTVVAKTADGAEATFRLTD